MNKYNKIDQLAQTVRNVTHLARYQGLTDDGEPIYGDDPLPTITFSGTVKLHGTNAGIEYNKGEVSFQSRSNKVTEGHFGFTQIPKEEVDALIKYIKADFYLNDDSHFVVFGEWAGQGIQKGVGISQLPKKFYVFDIFIVDVGDVGENPDLLQDNETYCDIRNAYYTGKMLPKNGSISLITKYAHMEANVDFENLDESLAIIKSMVDDVEAKCPVAAHYGIEGVGEGIVFKGYYKGERLIFKAKGDKHSIAKKDKVEKDPVKEKSIQNFVDNFVTSERVRQAIFELQLTEPGKQDTGNIVRWVRDDILNEESETLEELELVANDIGNAMSRKTANIFFDLLNAVSI